MKKYNPSLLIVIALVFVLAMSGCFDQIPIGPAETAYEPLANPKVGFIYLGKVGDSGYAYAHDQGRKYLEKELGVKTVYAESVPELNGAEDVMRNMIEKQGVNVIVATSYGYQETCVRLAKQYKNVKFLQVSGFATDDNLGTITGRMYEARFLSGIVAGQKTKTNKIGFVAAYEISEVISGIDAFTLGVKEVKPDAKVYVEWTHDWDNYDKEKRAALSLIDKGCDVLSEHQDNGAVQVVAQERKIWSIGYNSDMSVKAPDANMTSVVWNWGPSYKVAVKAMMEGKWKGGSYVGGLKDGIVDLIPLTSVAPIESKVAVKVYKDQISDGSFQIFKGPIKDNLRVEKVPKDKVLSESQIMMLDWFVEGVEGEVTK